MNIKSQKDFFSGLMFTVTGVAFAWGASTYTVGNGARMGPGYFPRILGLMLIVLGAIIALRGVRVRGEAIPKWKWRPTLVVLGSVVLFGSIVAYIGVAISTIVLIVASSAASHEFRWKESLIAGVILSALANGVFVIGLGLQLPIWPAFITG